MHSSLSNRVGYSNRPVESKGTGLKLFKDLICLVNYATVLAQCKGTQDKFWIPRCEIRIPGTGFQPLSVSGTWILDSHL